VGSPALFSGNFVKFLKGKLDLFGQAYILTGTQDPRITATLAPKGSILMGQGDAGRVYVKLDDGLTVNWKLLPFTSTLDLSTEPAAGFQLAYVDSFDVSPTEAASTVDDAKTNATYDPVRQIFRALCDKGQTVTTVGTAYTLSGAPSFTLAAGDIVYSGGVWRRIASVSTTTTGVLESAFSPDLTGAACMVSQAVWTKDLVNFAGDASHKTRPRDFFPGEEIVQINIDYFDSLAANDDVPDFVDPANMVVSASAEGLYTDTVSFPTSSNFTEAFARPAAPDQIEDYPLLSVSGQERLFLCFFPSPDNVSVTTGANLCRYRVSFYPDPGVAEGGILDSAFAMSDGSATEVNCGAPFDAAGKTRLTVNWNFIPNLNPGTTAGDLEVYVDGLAVPREVSGATTDTYYIEVPGTSDTIEFWTDLMASPVSIEVRRRQGSIDSSDQNAEDIATILQSLTLTSNTTLTQRSYTRVLANSVGGAFQITLPASPSPGDRIEVQDPEGTWFTNNVTINPNGNAIQSVVANDTLDVNYGWIVYEWFGGSEGWMVRT
jgi:hypothetical protein